MTRKNKSKSDFDQPIAPNPNWTANQERAREGLPAIGPLTGASREVKERVDAQGTADQDARLRALGEEERHREVPGEPDGPMRDLLIASKALRERIYAEGASALEDEVADLLASANAAIRAMPPAGEPDPAFVARVREEEALLVHEAAVPGGPYWPALKRTYGPTETALNEAQASLDAPQSTPRDPIAEILANPDLAWSLYRKISAMKFALPWSGGNLRASRESQIGGLVAEVFRTGNDTWGARAMGADRKTDGTEAECRAWADAVLVGRGYGLVTK